MLSFAAQIALGMAYLGFKDTIHRGVLPCFSLFQ
jgi:hypothetical protein